jgi:membrane-associated protease RseP (regulator of RpoE activity)
MNFFDTTLPSILTQIPAIIFWFIVLLTPLVVVHEFGHFLMARLFGVKIPEFGIGLPLTSHRITKKYKGTTFAIYPWLLGGFVRIFGDNDAVDEAQYQLETKNPDSKKNYIENRLSEVISSQEVEDILVNNSLEYSDDWKVWVKSAKKDKNFIVNLEKNLDMNNSAKLNTLKTLIEWEYDGMFEAKSKTARKEAFVNKNYLQKTLIIFGGIIFNFMFAFILFFGMFAIGGGAIPQSVTSAGQPNFINDIKIAKSKYPDLKVYSGKELINVDYNNPVIPITVQAVKIGSIADKGTIKSGDIITKIGNDSVTNLNEYKEFQNILNKYKGQKFSLEGKFAKANVDKVEIDATKENPEKDLKLGLALGYKIQRSSGNVFSAFGMAWEEVGNITGATVEGVGKLFTALLPTTQDKSALSQVSGPVGIGGIGGEIFVEYGFLGIVYLLAILSISLAVFNALPIPALDGGRFIIITLNKILGKRNKNAENIAIGVTFFVLIAISILVGGSDILKLFQK